MISCQQGFSIAIMAESTKGHNFAILGPTEKKNMSSLNFCIDATYKISRFYTNLFPRYSSKHLIFTEKGGITQTKFNALRLKANQHI